MTIWEKAVLNMQKGAQKINAAAAVFSERVKTEITIVRLRIRIDEVQARIDELHRTIGRTVVDLTRKNEMPKATEQMLKLDDVAAALNELVEREKEMEHLNTEIKDEQNAFKPVTKQTEDTSV